jgi:hypothetical protein
VVPLVLVVLEGDDLEQAVCGGEVCYADDPQAEALGAALALPVEGLEL